MSHRVALLLTTMLLTGCGAVVDAVTKTAEVLMDPSIPVGEQKDRASMVSLNLNATRRINPNLFNDNQTVADFQAEDVSPLSRDDVELVESPTGEAVVGDGVATQSPQSPEPNITPPAFTVVQLQDSSLLLQADWESLETDIEQAPEVNTLTDDERMLVPEATPLAFKVVQLKDNSLLLQADFESLEADIEKALGTTYLAHDEYMLVPGEYKHIEPFEVEDDTRYISVIAAFNDPAGSTWKAFVKIKPKGKEYALLLHFDERDVVIKIQE